MDFWIVYIITMLPSLHGLGIALAFLGGIFAFGMFVVRLMMLEYPISEAEQRNADALLRWIKRTIPATILGILLMVTVPTESQMRTLVAGWFVTNIEGIEEMPPQLVSTLNEALAALKAAMVEGD